MTIIEYKLHPIPRGGMRIPDFVTDGGYWQNPDDFTLIGTVPDGVEYYVPDTVTTYTLAELQARQRAIHAIYPMKVDGVPEGDDMNDTQVDAAIKAWVDAR
tara:strand:- start:1439 stop:1741 length:303 start_codon:yes stop_codon:yes gene_type:complete